MAKAVVKKKTNKGRKLDITPEERQRRSDAMRERMKQGKVGPQFGALGGRPKVKRASELVAEQAAKDAARIVQVFQDAIDPGQTITTRLKGAQGYLDIEKDERRLEMDEEEHHANMSQGDLAAYLAEKIKNNPEVRAKFLENFNASEFSPDDQKKEPGYNPFKTQKAQPEEEVVEAEVVEDD